MKRWAVVTVVTIFAALLLAVTATTPATGRPAAHPQLNESGSPLVANLTFEEWTWSGDPCQGSGSDYTAHFLGNASGGTPPYTFLWVFGDGDSPSTLQDPTHVYSSSPSPLSWVVTLTVTDNSEANSSTSIHLFPPAFSCPTEFAPGPFGVALWIYYLLGGLGVSAAAFAVVAFMPGGRKGRTGKPPMDEDGRIA